MIQLSVAHDMTWDNCCTTLRGSWKKRVLKHLKLCNSYYVEHLWIRWIVRSTWQMAIIDDLCEVHKIHSGISLGNNSKRCEDGSKWSEHKK